MFDFRLFLKKGLLDAVGKMPTYKIVLNAAGWLEKGVLDESDLAEIQQAIENNEMTKEGENIENMR